MCTFPRPEASVIPTQTPRRGRVLPGGGCPLGTPSPCEAVCFGAGDDAREAHRRGGLGAAGSAAGAAGGAGALVANCCNRLPPGTERRYRLQKVSVCYHFVSPAPQEQPHAGPRGSKTSLPWTGRRSAPYGNAEKKRNPFGRNSVLVRLCSVLLRSVRPAASK